MLDVALWPIVSIGLTFFLAGIVKGVTGMGLPTVAMGLLGAFMSPVAAAGFLIVPSFVTNLWQLASGPSFTALVSRLWLMMLGVGLGTVASSSVLVSNNTRWTTVGLGAALVIYAGFTLLARHLSVPARLEKWLSPLIGLTTGAVTGGTGVFVIPAVPYLQALGLSKDDLIQGLGLSFTISTVALAVGLTWRGAFQLDDLAMSSLAILPAMAGMWLGQAIRSRVSPAAFRRWFLICLLLLGTELILRSVL
ncbi:sulfite exporter TauE/SafE family protein [Microvirga aerophila]|uniref:Probable membrane transporter protein n=1 Tax=Microvirga aerophila TaxID=670291 RepID=A0A512C2U1_9HYPH|nr:sulfite exporter TauE/SafE family protein [Microvirga aerophila]GEO18347.1 membrane protein [Microvirga aerophila]